jgi:hypothetical protein
VLLAHRGAKTFKGIANRHHDQAGIYHTDSEWKKTLASTRKPGEIYLIPDIV